MSAEQPVVSTDLLQVRHHTRYRYARPVKFGAHAAMFRPHESNELRLTSFDIETTPVSTRRWVHDVFSNSITVFDFSAAPPSDVLDVICTFNVVRSTVHEPDFPIADFARRYPFVYPTDQWVDLVALIRPEYELEAEVKRWAESFIAGADGQTWTILQSITSAIHRDFDYIRREETGVQAPQDTLARSAGSCRDFAVLMMEATRQLGLAARFVTGYLYDPLTDQNNGGLRGAGATHAWVQVFLPGAGWIEFDPTNGLIASGNLIRTGVARLPSQAAPLDGAFEGAPEDFLGMDVDVEVSALAPTLKG